MFKNFRGLYWLLFLLYSVPSRAQDITFPQSQVQNTGISGVWVLANISYAGMRAQNNPSRVWRVLSFIFGLPGTIVSFFAVKQGTGRAYGIDIPSRN